VAHGEGEPGIVGAEELGEGGVVGNERGDEAHAATSLGDGDAPARVGDDVILADAEEQERSRQAAEKRDKGDITACGGDAIYGESAMGNPTEKIRGGME
jgi:hypothetical protein